MDLNSPDSSDNENENDNKHQHNKRSFWKEEEESLLEEWLIKHNVINGCI